MNEDVEGSFPKNDNEIIIGENLENALFDGNGIGKKITIYDDYDDEIEFNIVGINHGKNIDGIIYNYIPYKALLNVHFQAFFSDLFLESDLTPSNSSVSSVSGGYMTSSFHKDTIIWGKTPTKDSEIVVSLDMLSDLYYAISGKYKTFYASDLLTGDDFIQKVLRTVVDSNYYISANDAYKVKVVGIHNGKKSDIYVSSKWHNAISQALPDMLQCYCTNMDVAKNFDDSKKLEDYNYESYYIERFSTAVENGNLWKLILGCCIVLSLVVAFVLTNSYARIAIAERLYDIGIMKSLGGTKKDITLLVTCEQLHLGIASGLFATVFYIIALIFIPKIFNLTLSNIKIALLMIPLLLLVIIALCILLCCSKIIKVSKSKPIDDMRKRI